jgi:hypothetical protein
MEHDVQINLMALFFFFPLDCFYIVIPRIRKKIYALV